MGKTALIIEREYLTRVKKKSFIFMTIFSPLLVIAILIIPIWLSEAKDSTLKNIAIVDRTNEYAPAFVSNETYHFDVVDEDINHLKEKNGYYAIIVISNDLIQNPDAATVYAENHVSLEFKSYISNILSHYVENKKLEQYNIPGLKQIIEDSQTHINIKTVKWTDDGSTTETSAEIAMMIGMITAFLIYFFIIIYGSMVMRGIVEEKTSRIVEVIISSVRPFQLMLGKIIGIALVGLTQFVIWIILLLIVFFFAGNFLSSADTQDLIISQGMNADMLNGQELSLLNVNMGTIIVFFLIYFMGGYLLYASLFAAIGAASDSETDTQQFMLPITIPVVFALYAAIFSAANPDASLALWSSFIPFTSPIVMMVRIPLGVPVWQLVLSVTILIVSFIFTTWLAAKIYRTGILMYGKKISYKELWKWIRSS